MIQVLLSVVGVIDGRGKSGRRIYWHFSGRQGSYRTFEGIRTTHSFIVLTNIKVSLTRQLTESRWWAKKNTMLSEVVVDLAMLFAKSQLARGLHAER